MSDEWKLQHHVNCACTRCIDHPSQARPGIHFVSRPAACGDDAGESAALAVALLELLDV